MDGVSEFQRRLGARSLSALWEARRGMDLTRPASRAAPCLWSYADVRPDLMEAGKIITARDAFRRVLVLENPSYPGEMRVTDTLYAGLQLVRPGEIAPCHRHTQTALRFVVEGRGAYTSVDGVRLPLTPGDFVITPAWAWHDHCNDGDDPVVWLDGLDTPLVGFLDTVFREFYEEEAYPSAPLEGDCPLYFPYTAARPRLESLRSAGAPDPCHGYRHRYIEPGPENPAPTLAAFVSLLPAGFSGRVCQTTDGTVYCVAEGSGRTEIDGESFDWSLHDVFAVPGWRKFRHEAGEDAVLFSFSDRAAQEAVGLWRELRS